MLGAQKPKNGTLVYTSGTYMEHTGKHYIVWSCLESVVGMLFEVGCWHHRVRTIEHKTQEEYTVLWCWLDLVVGKIDQAKSAESAKCPHTPQALWVGGLSISSRLGFIASLD